MRAARAFWFLIAFAVLVALAGIGAVKFLDTDTGRAFVVRQLPTYAPKSGLTVRAGRIDGSIFGKATIHDLEIGDPKGVFARAAIVQLDWRPFDLARNLLSVRTLTVPELRVLRRPALRPSADKRILPDIDIAVQRLDIERIVIEAPVIGRRVLASLRGDADIRAGRARLNLDAASPDAGDSIRLRLDAEPDRDRFDMGLRLASPTGGIITRLLAIDRALAVDVAGSGAWSAWNGTARADLGGTRLADLKLNAAAGRFTATGSLTPASLLGGMAARLTAPALRIDASATFAERIARTTLHARSAALAVDGGGAIDFATETFAGVTLDTRVLQPTAIHPRIAARDLRLKVKLAGTFRSPLIDYVATAPQFAWGRTGFVGVRAVGIVVGGARPLVIPVTATATRVTGVGTLAEPLLTGLRVTGPLTLRGAALTFDAVGIRTDRVTARAAGRIDLPTGVFRVAVKGDLPNYLIPGVGVTNIAGDVVATPALGGARVAGSVTARVTRLDNQFFASLLEGLPTVAAQVVVAPDTSLSFSAARLAAPGLTLTASGTRTAGGIVALVGTGVSRRYGPLGVRLLGQIEAPVVDVTLARPGFGIGLRTVVARVEPASGDWHFVADGTTDYGRIDARGLVRPGSPTAIDVGAVTLAGITGRGTLVQTGAGPFAGRLALSGAGIDGSALLAATGTIQRADVALTAANAKLPLSPPVSVGSGNLRATVLLDDAGPIVTGRFSLAQARRADTVLTAAMGTIDYRAGRGSAQFDASGIGAAPFTLKGRATFAGDRIEVAGSGVFDRRNIGLGAPAVLTRDGTDWVLAPTVVITPDGRAEVSGRWGARSAIKARLDNLGLALLTVADPRLDFGGRVSGTIDLSLPRGGLPTGTAALRITGLSRAGLGAASLPIDIAVNAALSPVGGSARAVIVRGGAVEGRLQAQLRNIPGGDGDTPLERLLAAPLFAQARYNGPAQALWPLAGIEALDVRGPVRVAADIGGRLGQPTLTGTILSDGARVENVTLGTVVEKVRLDSRFTASRLDLTSFSGTIGKGSVTGSGSIGLSAIEGFPIDIRLALQNAQALKRDDLSATVTGELRLVSTRAGARIAGKLTADAARFRIGRTAASEVAVLTVREINAEAVRRRVVPAVRPTSWGLDIDVKGPRIEVEGMGLQSDWRGDLAIGGTATAPALSGRVTLIRGDYDFAGKRFQLTRGNLRFQGRYPPDPIIDIAAENTSAQFTATLAITGTGLRPEIAFGSVPALPQDEVLSRVLFGATIANLSAPEALQLAGALASLRGGRGEGLNPINLVRKGLGIDRLRILPADTVSGRRTSIAAGQYIGRRVYLELASDAQGYTATNIEVALTRSLSILSQVATQGGTSVNLRLKKDY